MHRPLPLQKALYLLLVGLTIVCRSNAAFSQSDEASYLANFNEINAASYAAVDDSESNVPAQLIEQCKKVATFIVPDSPQLLFEEVNIIGGGRVDVAHVKQFCTENSICIIPSGTTLEITENLNVAALIVRGAVEWDDSTSPENTFVCAGYVAVEGNGLWNMNLQSKSAWIYIKDNGAYHDMLRTRSFGGVATDEGSPEVNIEGRKLERTWSLLAEPLSSGDTKMNLLHNPSLMGWSVGDRIGIAPTEKKSMGFGEEFRIHSISGDGSITLDKEVQNHFMAEFAPPLVEGGQPILKSAEVVNLDRNIVITGDDFRHIDCDDSLIDEAVTGEQTSVEGCRCSSFRKKCTMGLHTIHMHGGVARIQNTRVEKCGQRGVEGKYCLHFHKLHDCPDCLFKDNAVENSHQRGIVVHGTHRSQVDNNILYNVRGSGIYIEDGNEMLNSISYNVYICNFPFEDPVLHGCTVPGTSNRIADTSDNQAGIFSRAATNDLVGNRSVNGFNGMLLSASGHGRGSNSDKVCEADSKIGRIEGNTFHSNGRFGTYTLSTNYPKLTDQSIANDGQNDDQSLCSGFDENGDTRGISVSFENNMDYHNAFVGHYNAGDIQYNGHQSYDNNNLIYWKETKNFQNGCSAHITQSAFARGNMAFPDMGTFIIEESSFGDDVTFEPNHHCNVGTTGFLCMPQYILHQVDWMSKSASHKWVKFQSINHQSHTANQNYGGIFTLSPPDADLVMQGQNVENSFFPPGFVSLVSSRYDYLLSTPGNLCVRSSELGKDVQYDDGILCKVPLRALKIYTKELLSGSALNLQVDVYHNNEGILGQTGLPDSSASIPFHQVGGDNQTRKQGYSIPIIPGTNRSYQLSLNGENIPNDWVIEFSDVVLGNRWNIEYIYLNVLGRSCGNDGLVSSHHDRKYIWSGDDFLTDEVWGMHGACVDAKDVPKVDCAAEYDGILSAANCPGLCAEDCDNVHSFCDCATAMCRCKEGFVGPDCSVDLCEAARCGEHGHCSAKYLGSSSLLPVTSPQACICDDGWTGPLCTFNPCLGKTCSGNGQCIGSGVNGAVCRCDPGFSGNDCETSCNGICSGNYPFGCSENIDDIVEYGCKTTGTGCKYLEEGESYGSSSYCTYKTSGFETNLCNCKVTDCQLPGPCIGGQCSEPLLQTDLTPCNSEPFGVCMTGTCTSAAGPSPTSPVQPTVSTPYPSKTPTISPSRKPSAQPASDPSQWPCGCQECDDSILNLMAGSYTCGSRMTWLQSGPGGSMTETNACIQIANQEFGSVCGPQCDPLRCGSTSASPSAQPSAKPSPLPDDLYCYPAEGERAEFNNMWSGQYTVQVKESTDTCGPGSNRFSRNTVQVQNGANGASELSLEFKMTDGKWEGSEVRVLLPNHGTDKFNYGEYKFHVKSVEVLDSEHSVQSRILPKDLVLGMFTWDTADKFVSDQDRQNWMHEVDVEISRWNDDTAADVQFLVQPPLDPQMYRFNSGTGETKYDPSNHWYSFNWLPGGIYWSSTAGGGQSHEYTVEDSVIQGRTDYVQCLPNFVEIRMNLWNSRGALAPDGLSNTDYVKVVIDDFQYTESNQKHIVTGQYCSKHCQCVGNCINGHCE